MSKEKQTWYVDIPKLPEEQLEETEYQNVTTFETRVEAIEFCKKFFGADDSGNVCLISGG